MIQAVLFDLDGTLADTALDLGGALNALLRRRGLPEKSIEDLRPYASHGANGLLEAGAGISVAHPEHSEWRKEYLEEYGQRYADETVLFDGINELLIEIDQRGLKWGIITNKPARFTDKLVPKLGFAVEPAVVVSGDTCGEAKPSVKPMHYACEQIGVAPQNCLYLGDAERDMLAAKNAGMQAVLVDWGYIAAEDRTEEWLQDSRIAAPLDLLALL
ncbi:HAD family hydrolase [Neisseria animalis]|uniref:phosphoglycolate phosphatase n=1 Tax=Neisseria animalis TaxID=492 RepID=A0A5P3MSU2_NEIAN|nr:HAD-IA family hydrolase [Neisseria animalis]QEY24677.1 HAD family hydrolase [Neisseria animalis]ROW31456.1 HAD family hydrolase [Neisseria animalis]VEE07623.1 phosphatase [Neisseria animalis]